MPSKKNLLHCKRHGTLLPEQVVIKTSKTRKPFFRCTICIKEERQRCYQRKKDYRARFATEEAYQADLQRHKENKKRHRKELTDGIVREHIRRRVRISKHEITPEMIEIQRAIIKIKREGKKSKSNEQQVELSS